LEFAIETRGLVKTYRGGVQALRGVDLQVAPGVCFGLLGPNGAGKSTLVKTLLSIVKPSGGSATLNGVDITLPQARRGVGYLPEGHAFPPYLTGAGVCEYFGRLAGLGGATLKQDIAEKLELVGMSEWARTKITKYSKGMKQRIGLAQALLGSPRIIFLDEPTDGLDPVGRQEVKEVIRKVCGEGVTVFLNSHLLAEVEQTCDHVAIMHKGVLLQQGPVSEITASVGAGGKTLYVVRVRTGELSDEAWAPLAERGATQLDGRWFRLELEDEEAIPALIDELRAAEVKIYELVSERRNLEQTFVELITAQPETGTGGTKGGAA